MAVSTITQFLSTYKDALSSYDKYRKDFIYVNLMHHKYVKENKGLEKEIYAAKLNKLINLYVNQININFSKKNYLKCSYAWENVGQYIEGNIWLCINTIESLQNEKSLELANSYYNNIQTAIKNLSMKKIKIYNQSIDSILENIKIQIENLNK